MAATNAKTSESPRAPASTTRISAGHRRSRFEQKLLDQVAPLHRALSEHALYGELKSIEDVRVFMEAHIFAVWDFMSLVKALQRTLTCTSLPWVPVQDHNAARFINEIVLGEESDLDRHGEYASHFEIYLQAMREAGAATLGIETFLLTVQEFTEEDVLRGTLCFDALRKPEQAFLETTFGAVRAGMLGAPHRLAAAFSFGREALLPDVFLEIESKTPATSQYALTGLTYYLRRHIEVDGEEHGPMAAAMVRNLCGDSERRWTEAAESATRALQARLNLWDSIQKRIVAGRVR